MSSFKQWLDSKQKAVKKSAKRHGKVFIPRPATTAQGAVRIYSHGPEMASSAARRLKLHGLQNPSGKPMAQTAVGAAAAIERKQAEARRESLRPGSHTTSITVTRGQRRTIITATSGKRKHHHLSMTQGRDPATRHKTADLRWVKVQHAAERARHSEHLHNKLTVVREKDIGWVVKVTRDNRPVPSQKYEAGGSGFGHFVDAYQTAKAMQRHEAQDNKRDFDVVVKSKVPTVKLTARKIRVNRGGYASDGRYFGADGNYDVDSDDPSVDFSKTIGSYADGAAAKKAAMRIILSELSFTDTYRELTGWPSTPSREPGDRPGFTRP